MGAPFVWFDLTVADDGQVADFYQGLFGWTIRPGEGGYQDWIFDSDKPWAGTTPDGVVPAGRWVPHVVVADLDAAMAKAVQLGGAVIRARQTGPAGTSVTVSDPAGALIALFRPATGSAGGAAERQEPGLQGSPVAPLSEEGG